jgi:hypothetical protein
MVSRKISVVIDYLLVLRVWTIYSRHCQSKTLSIAKETFAKMTIPQTPTASNDARERASWNSERDRYFLERLVAEQRNGKRSDSGFKKEAWKSVADQFNARFGESLSRDKIKTRFNNVRVGRKRFSPFSPRVL